MSEEQFRRETIYQITLSIVRKMKNQGLISEQEYTVFDTIMLKKYSPLLGGLYR